MIRSGSYSFTGHQTFPFRYTWLTKGIKGLSEDPSLFWRDDALVQLGVGKNMVSSIRFWCQTLGLIELDSRSKSGGITQLGTKLFSEDGWDPYLEDPATLWILHWHLVETPSPASTWHLAFTRWAKDSFSRQELTLWLANIARSESKNGTSQAVIKRDVDVFLRTYVGHRAEGASGEDSFDCPLAELGLIRQLEDGVYQFVAGPKRSLPDEIFCYALLTFWHRSAPHQDTISFERIMYDPGSPGAAFKLSENALATILENLPKKVGIQFDETAGSRTISRTRPRNPMELLETFYEKATV